jgi:hypothetical protein
MRLKIRGLISLGLLIFWLLSALSGLVLYFAPGGQRSGRINLLFDLSKHQWSDIHTWASFIALAITITHAITEWKIFIAVTKTLIKGVNKN